VPSGSCEERQRQVRFSVRLPGAHVLRNCGLPRRQEEDSAASGMQFRLLPNEVTCEFAESFRHIEYLLSRMDQVVKFGRGMMATFGYR
jgi:hypothetical protein